ncbi:MAG: hypothetical protein ABI239_05015, partial [Aquihabitans sp.]
MSAMQGGQVLASSITLIASGVLLTRGFTGLTPARPVFLILGMILVASALLGLGLEHVEVRSVRRAPDHVLVDEFHRSRRFDHPLSLVRVRCDEFGGQRVIARLRGTDRAWRQRGWLYVLLPETDGEGADLLVSRISAVLPNAVTQRASFPDDAVTVDGLYEALRDRSTSEISTAAALHESEVGGTVAIGRSTNGSGPVTV